MLELSSLTTLLAPLLLAAGVLVGIGVVDTQEVYIRALAVPPTFTRAGFTPTVVDLRIHDHLLAYERQARTRPETQRLATEAEKSPLQLVADYLNITLIARALQDSSRLIEYSISGSVVQDGENHVMRLSVRHRDGQRIVVTITRPVAEIEEMIQDAASGILQVIDPHIWCTIKLREGLTATPISVDAAQACVTEWLPRAADVDRIWLYNLQGVVAFMRDDHVGAMNGFREALRIDPDFTPAMLNLGILLAHNGQHEQAIRVFATVFRRATRGESPQSYAATYAEWGNSLLALGRREEALRRYADAVRADPRYALAYTFWANALPPGPLADQIRRAGERARQLNDQLYTENLVGVISETRVTPPN